MTNEKKNSRKLIVIVSIVAILVIALGVTYAFVTYSRNGTYNNKLIAGDIYMRYKEGSAINLSGAMPSSTYPSSTTGNYYEFQIIGKNTNTTKDITYNVKLAHGDQESGKTRIPDQHLVFKLVEVINNEEQTPALVEDQSYQTIPGTTIYTATIAKNTTNETARTFRLYARISENVGIGTDTTFTIDEWNDLYASIKVNVDGGFATPSMLGTTHIISNYEQDNNPDTNGGIVGINLNGDLYNPNATGSSTTTNNALTNNLVNKANETTVKRTDNETTIREYRYSGNSIPSDANASSEEMYSSLKNYIRFNNELWRIVGIFDSDDNLSNGCQNCRMKIVRNDPLSNVPSIYTNLSNKVFQLNSGEEDSSYPKPYSQVYWNYFYDEYENSHYNSNWTQAGLMYYLNEDNTGSYYNSIASNYKEFIVTTEYKLGNVSSTGVTSPQTLYAEERNTSSSNIYVGNSPTWTGKIGLLYPSDYAYSFPDDVWNSYEKEDNWINGANTYGWRTEWLLSPYSAGALTDNLMLWGISGIGNNYANHEGAIHPTLYLKSNTTIVSGDGSYNDPYTIGTMTESSNE